MGDSAYAIENYILPLYNLTDERTIQDDFNFFHSSARITVECAFGEINMRWEIFWKPLRCSLNKSTLIIEGTIMIRTISLHPTDVGQT